MKSMVLILLLLSAASYAQWSNNPALNLAICDTIERQHLPRIASTSDGGTYVSWFDYRSGSFALYLQRLDPLGYKMWTTNGILISNNSQPQLYVYDLMVDSDDNAVLVWNLYNQNVLAYKISPSGAFLWGVNGVDLSSTSGNQRMPKVDQTDNLLSLNYQLNPKVAQTNDGNFVVAWIFGSVIALQKLSPEGTKMWGPFPVLISSTTEAYNYVEIVPTDSNGVLILNTANSGSAVKLRAAKISSAGTVSWQMYLQDLGMVAPWSAQNFYSDMNNGGIIAWQDDRDLNSLTSSFVQRVSSSGSIYFPVNGTEVSLNAGTHKYIPVASVDPLTDETYVFWAESNEGNTRTGISGQKISSTGERMWTDNAKIFQPLNPSNTLSIGPLNLKSKAGKFFCFYIDRQLGSIYSIYTIKGFACDSTGNFLWPENIVTLSSQTSEKLQMVSTIDIFSNCKMAWADYRSGRTDIYAQDINENGQLGNPILPVELESFTAASVKGNVLLNWRTATEINNRGFEIERSQANSDFITIGFVEGKGTTTEKTSYSFTDQVSVTGKITYRLKQIDYDGTFSYSETAEVNLNLKIYHLSWIRIILIHLILQPGSALPFLRLVW
jgi:hypothetical protein